MMTQLIASTFCFTLLSTAPQGAISPPSQETVLVNFERTPLAEVVKWLNKLTGKNFVFESSRGTLPLTILSGTPVTVEEAFSVFKLALQAEGLVLVEQGPFLQILRQNDHRPPAPPPPPALGARIVPMFEDGQARGVRLFSIQKDSLLARWGLRDGDVILAIDGRALKSPADLVSIPDRPKPGDPLHLRILRQGKEKTLTFGEGK